MGRRAVLCDSEPIARRARSSGKSVLTLIEEGELRLVRRTIIFQQQQQLERERETFEEEETRKADEGEA